jgi:predicted DNA-binding transcriptional regulator AlpA
MACVKVVSEMTPKRIIREREGYERLGCGRTKFRRDYVVRDASKPNVPGTEIKRLKPIPLGERNIGFLEAELEALIDALVALRDAKPGRPRKPAAAEQDRKNAAP